MMEIKTIKIGNQIWMTKNLSVTTFQNGDTIPIYDNMQDFLKAGRHQEPACIFYENNPERGILYNFYAIEDERQICPEGFKIPTENDWNELIAFCGGENIAAKYLKSDSDWIEPENAPKPEIIIQSEIGNGLDSFGFNAKPMGAIEKTKMFAEFFGFGNNAYFWSADTNNFYNGWGRIAYMYYFSSRIMMDTIEKRLGMSVRCIKI
jgi:uncharacterized protein (TIGR02145 family)